MNLTDDQGDECFRDNDHLQIVLTEVTLPSSTVKFEQPA